VRLTEISIRALKAADSYKTYYDDTVPGFGVRVGKRTKTYVVVRGRNRERVSIGKFDEMKLSDARTEAKRLLSSEPEAKLPPKTFETARTEFIERHYRDKAERTKYNTERLLKRHFKSLEREQLGTIEDHHLRRCLDKLKDTPSEQLHAYRAVRCFLRWCVRSPRRYIKHSPMEGYEPPGQDRKGSRVLTDHELKAVWKAAEGHPHATVRLLVLWGTRNTETTVLEREWTVDGVLTIPGEHTKNGRDHAIPVLPLAQAVLDSLEGSNQHYIRSRWGASHLSARGFAKAAREVKERSETTGWTPRDLRRTFRSNMARLGVSREVCEVLINHAPPVLDEIYDRYDRIAEKRAALEKHEAFIQALIAQGST